MRVVAGRTVLHRRRVQFARGRHRGFVAEHRAIALVAILVAGAVGVLGACAQRSAAAAHACGADLALGAVVVVVAQHESGRGLLSLDFVAFLLALHGLALLGHLLHWGRRALAGFDVAHGLQARRVRSGRAHDLGRRVGDAFRRVLRQVAVRRAVAQVAVVQAIGVLLAVAGHRGPGHAQSLAAGVSGRAGIAVTARRRRLGDGQRVVPARRVLALLFGPLHRQLRALAGLGIATVLAAVGVVHRGAGDLARRVDLALVGRGRLVAEHLAVAQVLVIRAVGVLAALAQTGRVAHALAAVAAIAQRARIAVVAQRNRVDMAALAADLVAGILGALGLVVAIGGRSCAGVVGALVQRGAGVAVVAGRGVRGRLGDTGAVDARVDRARNRAGRAVAVDLAAAGLAGVQLGVNSRLAAVDLDRRIRADDRVRVAGILDRQRLGLAAAKLHQQPRAQTQAGPRARGRGGKRAWQGRS